MRIPPRPRAQPSLKSSLAPIRRAQLARLITFFEASRDLLPIAAMGIGKLGLESRSRLDQLGSALTYASIGRANVAGQPSLSQLRRAQRAYIT